jgi:hypothetical protein
VDKGKINQVGIGKIIAAVKGGLTGKDVGMSTAEINRFKEGKKRMIRPRDLSWGSFRHDRFAYVIELRGPVEAGINMSGGRAVYSRICVSTMDEQQRAGISGEWLTRQYQSREEAEFLMKVERKREEAASYDVVLAGVRGLSRILEIDNALIREVKRHFEESVGGSILVQAMTYQHSEHSTRSEYLDDYADETILVVSTLDGAGGSAFRKTWSRQNQGRGDLKIGSMFLQYFMEPEDIYGKPAVMTGRLIDIDARKAGYQCDNMGSIISLLAHSFERVHFIVKVDDNKGKGRWYGLLKRDWTNERRFDSDVLSIKDRIIPNCLC